MVVPAGGQRRRRGVAGHGDGMILQVRACPRQVGSRPDAVLAQVAGGADAGQHEELR